MTSEKASTMSLPTSYFTGLYATSADPWGFHTRWYEERKYALSVAALPRRRYRAAFEPGCSVGVLTALLAGRCDRILATDPAQAAVASARKHLTSYQNVSVECSAVPHTWPSGEFDLIVLSELGYYLGADDLDLLLKRTVESLEPGGDLLAVHWRHPVPDYPITGDAVHDAIDHTPNLDALVRHAEKDFVLEVFRKVPPAAASVAEAEGLL